MLISIEPASDVPIYLQLRNQIVAALVRGELNEGDSLPSVRQLATDLGINLHTVNKAYRVLQDGGYLRIAGRRGAQISSPPSYDDKYLAKLCQGLHELWIEASSHGISASHFQDLVRQAIANGTQGEVNADCDKADTPDQKHARKQTSSAPALRPGTEQNPRSSTEQNPTSQTPTPNHEPGIERTSTPTLRSGTEQIPTAEISPTQTRKGA